MDHFRRLIQFLETPAVRSKLSSSTFPTLLFALLMCFNVLCIWFSSDPPAKCCGDERVKWNEGNPLIFDLCIG